MDWSDWIQIRDQSFPSCHFDCDQTINYIGYDQECEETSLSKKACDHVRRILLGKENGEILKLEEDVNTLKKQLSWADISWSEIDSVPLSEKVKSIDLSLRSVKNKNSKDDHDFGESSLVYKELVEGWQNILQRLTEKYFDQKTKQANGFIIKEQPLASLQQETECIAGKENISCSATETTRKEVTESSINELVIADKHETDMMVKKNYHSLSTSDTIRKEVVEEAIDGVIKESILADLQLETDHIKEPTNSLKTTRNEEEVEQGECAVVEDIMPDDSLHVTDDSEELKEQNKVGLLTNFDISIPFTPILTNKSPEFKLSVKFESTGHISEPVPSDLDKISEETGKRESKGANIGIQIPGESLFDTQMNESSTLSTFVNKKREQLFKMKANDRKNKKAKCCDSNDESSSDFSLKSPKPKMQKMLAQKVKMEHDMYEPPKPSLDSVSKPQTMLKDHTISLPTNSTESSSMESLCSAITDARMEEAPKLLPSSRLPNATPGTTKLETLKLAELKAMAKENNLKGYSKFTKAKLIQELSWKILTRDNCT